MLPFLTNEFPALQCAIKTCDEDFIVEELPLYEPSGQGTHVYALIEKKGISTPDALAQIARVLGIPRWQIGFAGQKDARAVTRQWISVEHIKPEQLLELDIPKIKVLSVDRHGNKLKLGHLSGNRFVIRLRKLQIPSNRSGQNCAGRSIDFEQQGGAELFRPAAVRQSKYRPSAR